jgi:tRNA (guanine-N7-)-methyltransferase
MKADYGVVLSSWRWKLPLDLHRLSGGLPRTELEIGFGNGEFTVARAMACPDTLMIGIEVSSSCVDRCVTRVGIVKESRASSPENALANLKVICADARFMMKELFADGSLDGVIMNFPCPWPKKRHARRRVTAKDFADGLAAVLKVGGTFELVTDEEWYALDARDILDRHEALSVTAYEVNPARSVTTKYERKWLEMGKDVIRLTVTKTTDFTVPRRTWGFLWNEEEREEEGKTVHVKTGKPLPSCGLSFLFNLSGSREDAQWIFKKSYTANDGSIDGREKRKTFLVETISTDDEFEQRYYLKVVEQGNDTLVKLDDTAKPYLTPAVRFAVEDLRRCLAERV